MDISVIVVTYNQESTIRRALDSILAQVTDADFEIVIGDDCSSDGTEAICRQYAASYPEKIVYLRREKNMGVVRNYFDCIERSRGRYLADCAGDDFWVDSLKLQKQFRILEERHDIMLVATRWKCYNVAKDELSDPVDAVAPGEYNGKNLLVPLICDGGVVHLCTAMYRKSVIMADMAADRKSFVNPEFTCEDQPILLSMASAGSVAVLPDVTLYYSVGHESVSHRKSFADRFGYSYRAFAEARVMEKRFVPHPEPRQRERLDEFNRKMGDYLAAMAFRSGPEARFKERGCYEMIKPIPGGIKSKIYKLVMSNRILWRVALYLRILLDRVLDRST